MTLGTPHQQIGEIMRAIGAGQLDAAGESARALVGAHPDHPDALTVLAMTQGRLGEVDDAIVSATRAAEIAGDARPDIRRGLAQLLRSAGRVPEAITVFQQLVGMTDDPEAWYGLALCFEQTRRHDEAVAAARRALSAKPDHVMARITLARALRVGGREGAGEALTELDRIEATRLPPVFAVHFHTECGQCLDRLERYDEAFSAFMKGNSAFDAMPETMRISKDALPSVLDRTRTLLTSEGWSTRNVPSRHHGRSPVFVVGFPRSGTTMLEQMFGAHSGVITSDEAPFIRDLVREIEGFGKRGDGEGGKGYPEGLSTLDDGQIERLRERYWSLARKRLGADVERKVLVDKQPLNLGYLACIGRVFPGAKVVVVLRDPMDTVLSCFMQAFTPNQATVHFSSLRRAALLYANVMDLWLETGSRCGVEAMTVRYEDVTAEPGDEIRRCLAHAGLAWEEGVESFHEHIGRKFVSTPSYERVGKPISRKSVGRWVRYHDRVAGVLPLVERFRNEFGYARSE